MDEKIENTGKVKKDRRLLKGAPMMFLSVIVVLVVVPMSFMMQGKFSSFMRSLGVKLSPNINDGSLIARFEDPANDLLRSVPGGKNFQDAARALDIREFAVKKVRFHSLSGMGIESRLNLVFYFNGKLPNPFHSKHRFSLPVIHVFIKAPGRSVQEQESDRIPDVGFAENGWNFHVIIDGLHEQARIYDPAGRLLGNGVGLYVHREQGVIVSTGGKAEDRMKGTKMTETLGPGNETMAESTRITAALPMKIIGDPSRGEWSYYVVVGLADLRFPSMMFPRQSDNEPEIFDCVLPRDAGTLAAEMTHQKKPELLPLKVKSGGSKK
ncbi:MAG: hypothetical protein GTO45_31760 [Candidatus Aminicenantes bacterium]|nr:hypothetical protein [Candidatus Aminicenantes bacterium]NIM83349.1 hypothetical protein [Candidatus Aminicenantes bacterium]NIN22713.1 hypothetical protein [Candidatus Aminicenantes bacterium]NIN46473.1 hypothetical protein [Candidatus Aminicenantes bacterium]NIN89355.1 hypothetical protein [Candidatus Aminicenantes bacterium]